MKNVVVCDKCGAENPVYSLTCKKCNAFLRSRVNNIEFWKTFWTLFHSPDKAFLKIIYAKTKNLVFPLLVLFGIKAGLIELQLKSLTGTLGDNWLVFLILSSVLSIVLLIGFSYLVTITNKNLGLETRFKDNLAIYTYAFIPLIIALFILTGVEYALFGEIWFLESTVSLEINGLSANILLLIEIIMFLWSLILIISANYVQSKNLIFSIVLSIVLVLIVLGIPVLLI